MALQLDNYLQLNEKTAFEKERVRLQREFELSTKASEDFEERLEHLNQLFDAMGRLTGQELINLKLRLRQEIRRLIKRIDVYPEGNPRYTQEWLNRQLQSTIDLGASETLVEKHRQSLEEMVNNRKDYL